LQGHLDRWQAEAEHGERKGPFFRVRLTGADVFWLVEQSGHEEVGYVSNLHLEGADLRDTQLKGADLAGAYLESASLTGAHLENADLSGAYLDGAGLSRAHLERADLVSASLEGANLTQAHLEGANLGRASFDKMSRINNIVLSGIYFDLVIFDNTNLTVVDWSLVTLLGDEGNARLRNYEDGKPKTRDKHLIEYEAAVRANRMISANLQAQGLAEDGDRFAYRAQVLQRRVLWYQGKYGAYLFSLLLAGLAGYGYRLWRIFVVYGLAVVVFAALYFLLGVPKDPATAVPGHVLNAFLVSLTAIHGRVFFEQFNFTVQAWVAAIESIVGIVIEGVFVAMLIQRFFAR
jgi:uncharacterized protein YjbI with pentapeptide repeats